VGRQTVVYPVSYGQLPALTEEPRCFGVRQRVKTKVSLALISRIHTVSEKKAGGRRRRHAVHVSPCWPARMGCSVGRVMVGGCAERAVGAWLQSRATPIDPATRLASRKTESVTPSGLRPRVIGGSATVPSPHTMCVPHPRRPMRQQSLRTR
jgi:hypothetical protein